MVYDLDAPYAEKNAAPDTPTSPRQAGRTVVRCCNYTEFWTGTLVRLCLTAQQGGGQAGFALVVSQAVQDAGGVATVSYTHLTLPTKA